MCAPHSSLPCRSSRLPGLAHAARRPREPHRYTVPDANQPPSTEPHPYAGPERRRWSREAPPAPNVIGYARCLPGTAWRRPGIPEEWCPVLEGYPEGYAALPDYVWLQTPGKPLHVQKAALEFRSDPPP